MKRIITIGLVLILAQTSPTFAGDEQLDGNQFLAKHLSAFSASNVDTVSDTICGFAEMWFYAGHPDCGVVTHDFVFWFQNGNFVIRRTAIAPFYQGQLIPIEVIKYEDSAYDEQCNGFSPPIRLNPDFQCVGELSVDSVDTLGNLTKGVITFTLFLEIEFLDSIFWHNETSIYMRADVVGLPPDKREMIFESYGTHIWVDSNLVSKATCNGFWMNVTWCMCCIGTTGDLNGDGAEINILDLTFAVDRIFRGGLAPVCLEEGDVNGDLASTNILDLTFIVDRIFRGGSGPALCY